MQPNKLFEKCLKILKDRRSNYGEVHESFKRVADLWTYFVKNNSNIHCECDRVYFTARDVALMMALFKISREVNKHSLDNIIDTINYLALYEQNITENNEIQQ